MSPEVGNTRRRRGGDENMSNDGDVSNASHGGNGSRVRSETMRKVLLGLGFWIQGFRCFPWMGVNFFLKDSLRVDPSTLQILQSSANLPMVAKPFYGILSDSIYISGQHRIPYIAFGGWLFTTFSMVSVFILHFYTKELQSIIILFLNFKMHNLDLSCN